MCMHEDRLKSLNFEHPEYIPVAVSLLPAAFIKHGEKLNEIVARHPIIFGEHKKSDRNYNDVSRPTYVAGDHIDAWGCVWSNVKTGMEGVVTGHPVPKREDVHLLTSPEKDIGFPHGFMFLRLVDLRGFEEIMVDFAEEPPELQMLIDIVLEYNMRQGEKILAEMKGKGSIVYFGDDLGIQHSLPISPEKWRKYLKPCFASIYKPFRDVGHYVYMHTDGNIIEIIPDLIDCGVNVINPQIGANGLDNLVEVCKGKVCVDLDLNRQMFPFWTPEDIENHIHKVVEELGSPEGGLWLKAEVADDVPLENVESICSALEKYRGYFN